MFDVFEQPWTLLATAVIVHLVIGVVRIVRAKDKQWRYYVPTVLLIIAAFGLDFLVKTDLEKINNILTVCRKAVEQEDVKTLEAFISPNYSDSVHKSKRAVVNLCSALLDEPVVEKATQMSKEVEISAPNATVVLEGLVKLDERSAYSQYKPVVIVKVKLYFGRNHSGSWLINRIDVLGIDRHKMGWKDIGL